MDETGGKRGEPLDLTDPQRAEMWLVLFEAKTTKKKDHDATENKEATFDKTNAFLEMCGFNTAMKLASLLGGPEKLATTKFSIIKAKIKQHLEPKKRLVIGERTKFGQISRMTGESAGDYLARLREAARFCEFEKLQAVEDIAEEHIKMRFLAGFNDQEVIMRLMEMLEKDEKRSVEDLVDLVKSRIQVESFAKDVTTGQRDSVDVNYARDRFREHGKKVVRKNSNRPMQEVKNCRYCGRSHAMSKCPAFGKVCNKCHMKNHFATVCRNESRNSGGGRSHATHAVREDNSEATNEENIFAITSSIEEDDTMTEVWCGDKLENRLTMQYDSGASTSVISTRMWELMGTPRLIKSNRKLTAYDGHVMEVRGVWKTLMRKNGETKGINFVVVKCDKKYGLIGRDSLTSLDINSVNVDEKWPDARPWERLHMDWAYVKGEGNVLIIVDAGTGWIEAFPCAKRTTDNVRKCLRAVFSRFGIPNTLVSDNAKEFVADELRRWLKLSGCHKLESPTYHPRANGLAERGVQTIKRAMMAYDTKMDCSFNAHLQKVLLVHRNTASSRGDSPSKLLNGREMRIPIVTRFEIGEKVVYRKNPDAKNSELATYVRQKGQNTAWIEKDDNLVMASQSQLAPLGNDTSEGSSSDSVESERRYPSRVRNPPARFRQ